MYVNKLFFVVVIIFPFYLYTFTATIFSLSNHSLTVAHSN